MHFESREFDFSKPDQVVVIAEVGVNHNGDPKLAMRMVDAAIGAGVDIIKFQVFKSEKEISKFAAKTPYQLETTSDQGNQLEMCKALELSGTALKQLKDYCASRRTGFLCSAFDFDSVDLLVGELKVRAIKIASSEVTNLPFLEYIGSRKVGVILSTGASTLAEVGAAVRSLRQAGCPELALLHCVSSYPTPDEQVNLRAMATMREAFGLPVGFSDHTTGISVPCAAAALGACAIEKHFTLDRNMEGPDHRASVEPGELAAMAAAVRSANAALGSPIKQPSACELPNLQLIRKSLVAARDLTRGTQLAREMIEIKRPAGGIQPADLAKVIGRTIIRDLGEDVLLQWDDLA
jgi:N,N'-diacetyllegionaminate synthase